MESLMRQRRLAILVVPLVLLGVAVAAAGAQTPSPAKEPTVACDRIVLRARSGAEDGFRVLLGAVSMPGAGKLDHGSTRKRDGQWRYYRNAGLAIRAGASEVTISVPEGWRDRVAVSWGDSPASSSLRFAPCGASHAGAWNAYSGGFHLRTKGDCVPLVVTVGGMSTTVRIGVGRACGERG